MRTINLFAFLITLACSQNLMAQTPPSAVPKEQNNCRIELPYRAEQIPTCTPQTAAAYDFAFCHVAHIMAYVTAPEADKLLGEKSKAEAFKWKGMAYANISTALSDTNTFQRNVALTKNIYESLNGKSEEAMSTTLSYIRMKCDRVEATHAEVLAELVRKLKLQPKDEH